MTLHKTFPTTGRITEHFTLAEFACHGGAKCCGGAAPIKFELVEMLEELRARVGAPLKINSGFRCVRHNADVGGSKSSLHMLGMAADVATPTGWTPFKFAAAARAIGFGKVIKYDWGIHVDIRTW